MSAFLTHQIQVTPVRVGSCAMSEREKGDRQDTCNNVSGDPKRGGLPRAFLDLVTATASREAAQPLEDARADQFRGRRGNGR